MIAGRIVVHTEPQRYRAGNYQNQGWNRYSGLQYGDDETGNNWYRKTYRRAHTFRTESELLSILNKATCDGYVEGSRVERSSGNPGTGTITKIFRTVSEALDEDLNEFTPFRVTWDVTPMWPNGGTFSYTIEDLVLLSSPLPSEGNNDETLPNLPVSC